ncbi:hypothetical protein [Paenibacillus sp. 1P03SA]|uniref:hypothetical protein n=1 Tax=Paenibacillus sp. 1P03SA TaxID=3132294 RepID=UPI0039A1AF70
MTVDERKWKVERALHLRQRVELAKEHQDEASAYHFTTLLRELLEIERELKEDSARERRVRHQRRMMLLYGLLCSVVAVILMRVISVIYFPEYVKVTGWLLTAINVFFATYGAKGAHRNFRRGRNWRNLAWMNVGLFVLGLAFAVTTLSTI